MLHDDAVNLAELGEIVVSRASHVEFCVGPHEKSPGFADGGIARGWYVQSAKTLKVLATGFDSRVEALEWEKVYYSPSGLGWAELKGE